MGSKPKPTMPNINPQILKWARESAGMSREVAAHKLPLGDAHGVAATDRLAALESGHEEPTRVQLRNMARSYRRPLISFYLEGVPQHGDRGHDFRRLPGPADPGESGLLDALLRDLKARQGLLRTALEDEEDTEPLAFIGSMTQKAGVRAVAQSITKTIGFSRDTYRRANGAAEALKWLRERAEVAGVFVLMVRNLGSYHTNFGTNVFRGIALTDFVAPLVAINAGDSKAAQAFTLLHELAHLWLGSSGVSGSATAEGGIERFCNDVASEMLVPANELEELELPPEFSIESAVDCINAFAGRRNVSRAMVAYKLFRDKRLNFDAWTDLRDYYKDHWLKEQRRQTQRQRTTKGGPDRNVVDRSRLGIGLLETTKRLLRGGGLSTTEAGKVLGVKPARVGTMLQLSGTRANAEKR